MTTALALLVLLQSDNALTPAEARAGWKLLFDGKTTKGWHNFREKSVRPGWKVENGTLTCSNPETAGDILTDAQFDWFELKIDVNLGKGQNSGLMFRVDETKGEAPWHSGPEVQFYDHPQQAGVETTGFLYQLYGAKTDAAKPAGEWNSLRIMVDPKLCFTEVNGVRYHEYVYGSADFWERVKKSKFSKFDFFGKAPKGSLAIQGDHGIVSFRNIKIRPISR